MKISRSWDFQTIELLKRHDLMQIKCSLYKVMAKSEQCVIGELRSVHSHVKQSHDEAYLSRFSIRLLTTSVGTSSYDWSLSRWTMSRAKQGLAFSGVPSLRFNTHHQQPLFYFERPLLPIFQTWQMRPGWH